MAGLIIEGDPPVIRPKPLIISCLLVCAAGLMVSMNGCGTSTGTLTTPPPTPKIEHVVILFQENRTPDNLFQDQKLINAGADIKSSGLTSTGNTVQLAPIDLGTTGTNPQNYDLSHAHQAFVSMYDNGAMDGADKIACAPVANCNVYPHPQYMYVKPADVQPYFAMAEQYTFGDKMFQTNQGPSMPAHQYIISGTSWNGTQGSNLYEAENPYIPTGGITAAAANTGCTSPPSEYVYMIDVTNQDSTTNETTTAYPCFDHPTLIDLLDKAK